MLKSDFSLDVLMRDNFIIITASYKRPSLLRRNIESLQNQSYKKWLHIIVDDGSDCVDITDLVAEYEAEDGRVVGLSTVVNSGCNAARNLALEYIEENNLVGYVCLVDDDDYLLPSALEEALGCIKLGGSKNWLIADNYYPDGKKASRLKRYGHMSYVKDGLCGDVIKGDSTHFIHTAICKGVRFPEVFKNGQEWYFFALLSEFSDVYAFDLPVKITEYLEDGLSVNKINQSNRLKSTKLKVDVLRGRVTDRELANHQLLYVRELVSSKKWQEALDNLSLLAKYHFLKLRFYRYLFKALVGRLKDSL